MNRLGQSHQLMFHTTGSGELVGDEVQKQTRYLSDLTGIFADEKARQAMDGQQLAYQVQLFYPVPEGTAGGLFFGNTTIYPGKVGDEYFMTKGHFHALRDRGEYYWCLQGTGALILMDEARHCRVQWMAPGSLHYIPGHTAHRVANTGDSLLTFGACWPADAGHDYTTIAQQGFSERVRCVDGQPTLIPIEVS